VKFATAQHRESEGFELPEDALLELHARYPDRYPILLESIGGGPATGECDLLLALPGEQLTLRGDLSLDGARRRADHRFLGALDDWFGDEGARPDESALCF
jgi:hypothetical protein